MRKHALLAIIVMSLLLIGCVGGGSVPGPLPNPNPIGPNPPETDPEAIFDGSPTLLSAQFHRASAEASSFMLASSTATETAYVHIRKGDVYSVSRSIDIPPGENFTLDLELPAEKGYTISAAVSHDGRLINIGRMFGINVPASTLTKATVSLTEPGYELEMPSAMYSGGWVDSQVKITLSQNIRSIANAQVYLGLNPWTENGLIGLWLENPGNDNSTWWVVGGRSGQLPEVSEPTKLYYQVGISPSYDELGPGKGNHSWYYAPNLDDGIELPYIMIYPGYPDN